jgi:hypothetical protein
VSRAVLFLEDDEILDTSRISPAIVLGRAERSDGGRLEDTLAAVERRAITDASIAPRATSKSPPKDRTSAGRRSIGA